MEGIHQIKGIEIERKYEMRVTLLLAQCTSDLLQRSVQIVANVLQDLEIEIHRVELNKLPYFEGTKTRQMDSIMASIESSDGVIAISAVPMMGMHGAMQSFFDNATQYDMKCFNKPMLAVTYSEWLGEQEAAQMMLKCWGILGGVDGGAIYMNKAIISTAVLTRLEKEVENFYRLMKQERPNIGSSERALYYNIKQGHIGQGFSGIFTTNEEKKSEIRNFADIVREDSFAGRMKYREESVVQITPSISQVQASPRQSGQGQVSQGYSAPIQQALRGEEVKQPTQTAQVTRNHEATSHRIDIATKEQTIKEIAQLLEKEAQEDTFQSMQSGVYTRPPQVLSTNITTKKLQQIPHYFTAQYDKELNMVLKYKVTDIDEAGYIVIRYGDCIFTEELDEIPTVEISLTEEVLKTILSKKITYQKAFMLGKLKVKGNFSVLPKLDQVFKAL